MSKESSQQPVPVITIDGPSGSGKGTISQRLADQLGWHFLDSGALYRLLGYAACQASLELDDEQALVALAGRLSQSYVLPTRDNPAILLDGKDVGEALRTETCAAAASTTAALPLVRQALLSWQRHYRQAPGLVADGRDMGTVVFPDALLKVYLTASPRVRAERRYNQLKNKGVEVDLEKLVQEVEARDQRDSSRKTAPLRPADDALVIDSSAQDAMTTLESVLKAVRKVV